MFGLALTSGTLAARQALTPTPARSTEVVLLVTANRLTTLLRFVLLRGYLDHRTPPGPQESTYRSPGPIAGQVISPP